jgi:DNA-binding response OmpR family regulator
MHELADNTCSLAMGNGGPRDSQPTILCVDDDPEIARIWKIRLARHGMVVVSAATAADGFAAAVHRNPDLILLDLCMPAEDGNQVLARLRRDPRTRAIPVLMLTGGDLANARQRTSSYCADGYLMKPVSFAELLKELEAYLPISTTNNSENPPVRAIQHD